jgi:hypothetical protein
MDCARIGMTVGHASAIHLLLPLEALREKEMTWSAFRG